MPLFLLSFAAIEPFLASPRIHLSLPVSFSYVVRYKPIYWKRRQAKLSPSHFYFRMIPLELPQAGGLQDKIELKITTECNPLRNELNSVWTLAMVSIRKQFNLLTLFLVVHGEMYSFALLVIAEVSFPATRKGKQTII